MDSELLEAVRPAAVCKIWEFNPQDLANAAWASAYMGSHPGASNNLGRPLGRGGLPTLTRPGLPTFHWEGRLYRLLLIPRLLVSGVVPSSGNCVGP